MYVEPKYNLKHAKETPKAEWLKDFSGDAKVHAEKWYDKHVKPEKEVDKK